MALVQSERLADRAPLWLHRRADCLRPVPQRERGDARRPATARAGSGRADTDPGQRIGLRGPGRSGRIRTTQEHAMTASLAFPVVGVGASAGGIEALEG